MTIKDLKQFIKKAKIPNDAIVMVDYQELQTEADCVEYAPDATPVECGGLIVKALYIHRIQNPI